MENKVCSQTKYIAVRDFMQPISIYKNKQPYVEFIVLFQ